MYARVLESLRQAERAVARSSLRIHELPKLISVIFHAVVEDAQQFRLGQLDPRYCLSVRQIEECILHYLNNNYIAVTPEWILRGLQPDRKYVMFTFDDGYYNNLQVLPLLECYRVPAVFAITTGNVLSGHGFWWDILYRHAFRDKDLNAMHRAATGLIPRPPGEIERVLRDRYGVDSLRPAGDLDRPLSAGELRSLARHPQVVLANHTCRHESLSHCTETEIQQTIDQAQCTLEDITGRRPSTIVYPYGHYNGQVMKVSRRLGLKLGLTVGLARQMLPLSGGAEQLLSIPRVPIVPDQDIRLQCELSRLDWRPLKHLKQWYLKLCQRSPTPMLVSAAQEGWW